MFYEKLDIFRQRHSIWNTSMTDGEILCLKESLWNELYTDNYELSGIFATWDFFWVTLSSYYASVSIQEILSKWRFRIMEGRLYTHSPIFIYKVPIAKYCRFDLLETWALKECRAFPG